MSDKTYTFHVKGMHCRSCVLLIESEISSLPNITHVKSDLNDATLHISGEFSNESPEAVAQELTGVIAKHGYELSTEKTMAKKNWNEFYYAIPFALVFLVLFFLMQKAGLVNMVDASTMSYRTVFLIGIVASLSTCMAVVGGLVLSLSAEYSKPAFAAGYGAAKEDKKFTPPLFFHVGRLISFFVLGGILGALGSVFQINATVSSILGIIVALVMLLLGIDLLGVFQFQKKFQPSLPKSVSKRALGVSRFGGLVASFFIGVSTFFLPCGFTQSMQVYALSTGNFWQGAVTMFTFALGTLPALAAISFGAWSIGKSEKAGVFFKTAGIIVVLFAIFNLVNSLAAMGVIRPIFNI